MGPFGVLALALAAAAARPPGGKFTINGVDIPYLYFGEPAPARAPLLIVLPEPPPPGGSAGEGEYHRWQPAAAERRWRLLIPLLSAAADPGVLALEAVVARFSQSWPTDPERVYLAGEGAAVAGVFYAAARCPHLVTAAAALNGSPKAAIDSDRFYAANTQLVPLFWSVSAAARSQVEPLRQKLVAAQVDLRFSTGAGVAGAAEFLAGQRRDEFPLKVDCETGSTAMGRCYWVRMVKFDAARRNDALPHTRIAPDVRPSLELGPFGFEAASPGPGVLVEWLPPDYKGPLRLKDRIVALGGKPVADARHYLELMEQETRERPVSVMIERNRERLRLQTFIRMPPRAEVTTARIVGEFSSQAREIVLISRAVAAVEMTVPKAWIPASVNWNGLAMAALEAEGCYQLSEGAPGARRCGP